MPRTLCRKRARPFEHFDHAQPRREEDALRGAGRHLEAIRLFLDSSGTHAAISPQSVQPTLDQNSHHAEPSPERTERPPYCRPQCPPVNGELSRCIPLHTEGRLFFRTRSAHAPSIIAERICMGSNTCDIEASERCGPTSTAAPAPSRTCRLLMGAGLRPRPSTTADKSIIESLSVNGACTRTMMDSARIQYVDI